MTMIGYLLLESIDILALLGERLCYFMIQGYSITGSQAHHAKIPKALCVGL